MDAEISQGHPKALPATQNASRKSRNHRGGGGGGGGQNKEVGGQSLDLVR